MSEPDYTPDDEAESSLTSRAKDAWTATFRALVSTQAQKAYLGTALFITTSLLMLCVSSIAYGIFYLKFIPQVGFERVVHLQFGDGHPWGIASVGPEVVSLQPYDVDVKLDLPRTPSNLAAGNFMLDLTLFSRPSTSARTGANTAVDEIAKSRRPAILTYASSMVDTASKLSLMPLYVIGWHREAETMQVRMMEGVEFPRGWRNLPESMRLEIHSDERMQVYSAKVQFRAKFSGLRWIMYNWRLSSFLVFSFLFWSVSMLSTSVVWIALASSAGSSRGTEVKGEQRGGTSVRESDDEAGDTSSRGSDSGSSDGPPKGRIKNEEEPGKDLGDIPVTEVAGSPAESGAGTGLESPAARGMQRRRSRQFEGEGS